MFTVNPQVPIVGMLGHFTIRAEIGTFEAHGREMLAAQQQTGVMLTKVGASGTVIGWSQSGTPIVPGAVDYVAWTERLAGFAGRPELQGTPGSLWITGRMSPEAQRQFASLGWTIQQNVSPPWQR